MKNISTKSQVNFKTKLNKFILKYIKYLLISLVIFFLISFALLTPAQYIQYSFDGIKLWVNNVLPSLFPFFIFSKIILDLNLLAPISQALYPVTNKLYKTNKISCNLFLLSIVSGYPIGSKLISDAYKSNKITYTDLIKLNSYTSISGPLFIIGTVGVKMLKNQTYGYILYIGQIIGALINGLLYRNLKYPQNKSFISNKNNKPEIKKNILSVAISNAITSILQIGGLICIFYIALNSINGFINLTPILNGLIELTNGCNAISILTNNELWKLLSCSILLSFGGLCIHAQCMDYLSEVNFPYKIFLLQKCTQTLISLCTTYIVYIIIF